MQDQDHITLPELQERLGQLYETVGEVRRDAGVLVDDLRRVPDRVWSHYALDALLDQFEWASVTIANLLVTIDEHNRLQTRKQRMR
jgi:hypothetical protein